MEMSTFSPMLPHEMMIPLTHPSVISETDSAAIPDAQKPLLYDGEIDVSLSVILIAYPNISSSFAEARNEPFC